MHPPLFGLMSIFVLNHHPVGRSTHDPRTAGAHINYITRVSACSHIIAEHMPLNRHDAQRWINQQEEQDRRNARVCDRVMVTFPRELHPLQYRKLLKAYIQTLTKGRLPYYAAIHDMGKDKHNPHAHIVIRDRDFETGKTVLKTSSRGSTRMFRAEWETAINQAIAWTGQKHSAFRDKKPSTEPARKPYKATKTKKPYQPS